MEISEKFLAMSLWLIFQSLNLIGGMCIHISSPESESIKSSLESYSSSPISITDEGISWEHMEDEVNRGKYVSHAYGDHDEKQGLKGKMASYNHPIDSDEYYSSSFDGSSDDDEWYDLEQFRPHGGIESSSAQQYSTKKYIGRVRLQETPEKYLSYLKKLNENERISKYERILLEWATSETFYEWLKNYPNDPEKRMEVLRKVLLTGDDEIVKNIKLKPSNLDPKEENNSPIIREGKEAQESSKEPLIQKNKLKLKGSDNKLIRYFGSFFKSESKKIDQENVKTMIILILDYAFMLTERLDGNRVTVQSKIMSLIEEALENSNPRLDGANPERAKRALDKMRMNYR